MPERGSLSQKLPDDASIWQGISANDEIRRRIIDALLKGAIAIEAADWVSDRQSLEQTGEFVLEPLNAGTFLIPRRYQPMLRYFLKSPFRPSPNEVREKQNMLITGGPGTGKSYQITQFISALASQKRTTPLRVKVAAPTGKAAARFAAIASQPNMLIECLTIHRLLQMSPDGGRAKYHALNPLPVDVLIIDEISMVDLGLFSRVIAALPAHAQIVLAGDTGQLPAVDGIAIAEALQFLQARELIAHLHLTQTHRFSAAKGATYAALQQGGLQAISPDAEGIEIRNLQSVRDLYLFADSYARENFCSVEFRALGAKLADQNQIPETWNAAAREALARIQHRIILCETNEGNSGTRALNEHIGSVVARVTGSKNRHLTPIMITANSYELQLFNGDTGCIMSDGLHDFAIIESGSVVRKIPLARLRNWQIAYAITVHKSQGSEYNDVYIVLGHNADRGDDHRLLYTAVTRAKESATILKVG